MKACRGYKVIINMLAIQLLNEAEFSDFPVPSGLMTSDLFLCKIIAWDAGPLMPVADVQFYRNFQ